MVRVYEAVFNGKVEHFKDNPAYPTFRKNADWCIVNHKGFGYNAIKAADFMDRIICMPLDYIEKYLNGENGLEWTNKETGERYDAEQKYPPCSREHVVNALNRQIGTYRQFYKEA